MCGQQSSRNALHERRRRVSGLFWFAMLLEVTFGSSMLSYRQGRGHSRNLYAFVPSAGIRGLWPLSTTPTQRPHSLEKLNMIGSLFNWKSSDEDGDEVPVLIESPNSSTRRISSSIIVNRPIEDVWRILTDYDRLADYVPNLTQSKVIGKPPGTKTKGVRLFQVSNGAYVYDLITTGICTNWSSYRKVQLIILSFESTSGFYLLVGRSRL